MGGGEWREVLARREFVGRALGRGRFVGVNISKYGFDDSGSGRISMDYFPQHMSAAAGLW